MGERARTASIKLTFRRCSFPFRNGACLQWCLATFCRCAPITFGSSPRGSTRLLLDIKSLSMWQTQMAGYLTALCSWHVSTALLIQIRRGKATCLLVVEFDLGNDFLLVKRLLAAPGGKHIRRFRKTYPKITENGYRAQESRCCKIKSLPLFNYL